MNWLTFVMTSLACFRLTRLITDDKITDWLRRWVRREAPKKAKEGISCPFCVSFYYANILTGLLVLLHMITWQFSFIYSPAVWGASVLFNQLFTCLTENS